MIHTICICGAGTMGTGIAQLAAQSGVHVILFDHDTQGLDKAKRLIDSNLSSLAEKIKFLSNRRSRLKYLFSLSVKLIFASAT